MKARPKKPLRPDAEQAQSQSTLSRRQFMTGIAGAAAGAGVILSPRLAAAQEDHNNQGADNTPWPAPFNAASLNPIWNPRALPQPGDQINEYDMELTISPHELVPGVVVHMYTYNKTVPGPEIRVKEGDWVKVNFRNTISETHTIHWHGMMDANEMDGVPLGTQWPVSKGQTYQYLWKAQPAGTHYYHCHNMTPLHIQAGMYGALIIEGENDPIRKAFPYTRDYTMVLCEHDTNYMNTMMSDMGESMGVMNWMNHHDMSEMSPLMMGWFQRESDLKKAIANGYIPPYVRANTGPAMKVDPNFFTINGKSYPATEPLYINSGETIRVRLVGAGAAAHWMHLHGHDFWHVAQDGSPLPAPIRGNTVIVQPGKTQDIIIYGSNPGNWHFHDHSDKGTTNNGIFPGGMMTMLMYEDARQAGVTFDPVIAISS